MIELTDREKSLLADARAGAWSNRIDAAKDAEAYTLAMNFEAGIINFLALPQRRED